MSVATGVGKGAGRRVLPYEPFERALYLRERSVASLGADIARSVSHAKSAGAFTRHGADLAACALGMHVSEIWPEWYL